MENNNNKLKKQKTFFTDRFPYIIFILIIGLSFVIFFIIKDQLPLDVFTKKTTPVESQSSLDLYFASPTKNQSFELVNENETVPIEIKGKNIENDENYNINIFLNNELIKTLNSAPFVYNWNPTQTGAYDIYAEITDKDNKVLYTSEKISFSVDIKGESPSDSTSLADVNLEEKKNKILEETSYRSQNASPVFALKSYEPPVIDANIDEWDFFDKFSSFNPTILKENYTNSSDVSGVFSSCWDDNNFYFFIKVTDDVYNQPFNTNQINKGDSVVFVIDTELEEDFNIPFLNNDDYQIEFSAGNNSGSGAESFVRWPSNAPLKGAVLASKKGSGGYTIEGSIPWYSMPALTPADEIVMGFTVSIFDTDNMESTELVVSSSKQFDLNNVSTIGTIILIDGGDLSAIDQSSSTTDTTENQ
ncbi:MAG: sugar-binding protein [Candidatus Humimicrobiaceae bacterium]